MTATEFTFTHRGVEVTARRCEPGWVVKAAGRGVIAKFVDVELAKASAQELARRLADADQLVADGHAAVRAAGVWLASVSDHVDDAS